MYQVVSRNVSFSEKIYVCKKWMIPNQRFSDVSRGTEREQLHEIGLIGNFNNTFIQLVCKFEETHSNSINRTQLLENCARWFIFTKNFARNHCNQQCDWYVASKKPIWLLENEILRNKRKAINYTRKNASLLVLDRVLNTPLLINLVHKSDQLFPMHPLGINWIRQINFGYCSHEIFWALCMNHLRKFFLTNSKRVEV